MKLRRLLPSLRQKKRYLVFEVIAKKGLEYGIVKASIRQGLSRFMGELGMARAEAGILKEWKNNKGIIVVNRDYVDEARAGMALIKNINNDDIVVRTVGVSGILNKAKTKWLT